MVSGNRMVPAGVSYVCLQCLLSHTVREHVILFVHAYKIITLPLDSVSV